MNSQNITLAILSGGQSSRMDGADKGLKQLNGVPMVQHVIQRVQTPKMPAMIIANRNLDQYGTFQLPVYSDQIPDYQGPLAGLATALAYCKTPYLLIVPCDTPALPEDLAQRMMQCMVENQAEIVVAHDGYQDHPSVVLVQSQLQPSLIQFLSSGQRKMKLWYRLHRCAECVFTESKTAFTNVNTPAQLQDMAQQLQH